MTPFIGILFAGCVMHCAMHPHPSHATHDGIAFASGGIGIDERDAMLAARKDFNLGMTFAVQRSGEYLADVGVRILDAKGKTVFETAAAGPLLYVKLPAGRYRVDATARLQARSQTVQLPGAGRRELVFYWPAE